MCVSRLSSGPVKGPRNSTAMCPVEGGRKSCDTTTGPPAFTQWLIFFGSRGSGGELRGPERQGRRLPRHPPVREDEAHPGRQARRVPLRGRHRVPEERHAQDHAEVNFCWCPLLLFVLKVVCFLVLPCFFCLSVRDSRVDRIVELAARLVPKDLASQLASSFVVVASVSWCWCCCKSNLSCHRATSGSCLYIPLVQGYPRFFRRRVHVVSSARFDSFLDSPPRPALPCIPSMYSLCLSASRPVQRFTVPTLTLRLLPDPVLSPTVGLSSGPVCWCCLGVSTFSAASA